MSFHVVLAAAICLGPYALYLLSRTVLRLLARHAPSEIAGPDGLLVDTRSGTGIFDV